MHFEVHITVDDVELAEKERFVAFCQSQGVKPVLIELDKGNHISQPMITALLQHPNFQEANEEVEKMATSLEENGFIVVRKKVEISPKETSYFFYPIVNSTPYFEWHGKVEVDDVEQLKALCERKGGHISRNSLKKDGRLRFITVREYGGPEAFYETVNTIHEILTTNNIPLLKEEYELCIYDTREELDSGWVPQPAIGGIR